MRPCIQDPLRLGANSALLPWYQEAELYNGRVAMFAVPGVVFTEFFGLGNWWEAGAKEYAIDIKTQIAVIIVTFALLEAKRVQNFKEKGITGFLSFAPFDPAGLKTPTTELNEVKNARLAMVAAVGIASQTAVRGLGPIAALQAHLADPGHVNIFTSSVGPEATVFVALSAFLLPQIILSKNALSGTKEEFNPIPWASRPNMHIARFLSNYSFQLAPLDCHNL